MIEHLRKVLWISAFVYLAMTGFGSYVWSASEHSQDVVKIETKKPDRTAESEGQGNRRTKPTKSPLRLVQASQTEKADNTAPHNPAKDAEEASEYWTIVGRKLKVTDTLLAIFTFLLIPVGAFQAIFLWRTVVHMRISERAHVSGGANHVRRRDNDIEGLIVTINNYGKTPANIGTVAATICEEGELKTFPGWKIKAWPGHEFSAEWKGYVFGQVPGQLTDVVFPFQAGKVIAGRIWYRDIFQKRRSVGFLLKTDDLSAIGRREFWEEREEKDPNE